jgi:penicillin-binding protein 1A
MAGTTRAAGRGTDVDPFGSPTRDVPAPGRGGPRPGNGAANGHGGFVPQPGGNGNGGPPYRSGGPSGERPAKKKRSIIWRWRRAFFLLALMGLLAVAAGGVVLAQTELPAPADFDQASFICAGNLPADQSCSEATSMAKLQGDDAGRVNIAYEDLSPHIINAVVAVEDRDFFEHDGVAPLGIARALFRDLKGDAVQQGGSTITQQYVKKAYLQTSERTLTRKFKEAVLSIKLEQRMTKEEILEGYLNTIYFGRWAYGIQAASQAYFNMDVNDLGVGQAAYLAGLIRAPEAADYALHPEEATRRRHTALIAMEQEGYISHDEARFVDGSSFESMGIQPRETASRNTTTPSLAAVGGDYVTGYVVEQLKKPPFNFSEEEIYGKGLRVYTTLDPRMQEQAFRAVYGVLDRPEDPAAGLVAVDDQGNIRAMVGGRDFKNNPLNYAISSRPVGSTFKPIALAQAMSEGYSLESRYDAPGELKLDQTPLIAQGAECATEWTVNNYKESEGGNMSLLKATEQSSNTAYAQVMQQLGPDKVIAMATKLGMPDKFPDLPCLTTVLGTENASPLDMAGVYSVFANRGLKKTPSIITKVERVGEEGERTTLYTRPPVTGEQVITQQTADLVTHTLEGVIREGTGTAADIGRPAAGKTGTSQRNKDAWFVGYVPKLTAAVWMGFPNADWTDPETGQLSIPPMNGDGKQVHELASVTGGSLPAQIWHDFMLAVTEERQMNDPFTEVPDEVVQGGMRLEEVFGGATTTTTGMPQPQPGVPGPESTDTTRDRPGRPGSSSSTTSSSSTSSSSTSSSSTSTSSTTFIDTTLPTIRPGGGGPGGGGG